MKRKNGWFDLVDGVKMFWIDDTVNSISITVEDKKAIKEVENVLTSMGFKFKEWSDISWDGAEAAGFKEFISEVEFTHPESV